LPPPVLSLTIRPVYDRRPCQCNNNEMVIPRRRPTTHATRPRMIRFTLDGSWPPGMGPSQPQVQSPIFSSSALAPSLLLRSPAACRSSAFQVSSSSAVRPQWRHSTAGSSFASDQTIYPRGRPVILPAFPLLPSYRAFRAPTPDLAWFFRQTGCSHCRDSLGMAVRPAGCSNRTIPPPTASSPAKRDDNTGASKTGIFSGSRHNYRLPTSPLGGQL